MEGISLEMPLPSRAEMAEHAVLSLGPFCNAAPRHETLRGLVTPNIATYSGQFGTGRVTKCEQPAYGTQHDHLVNSPMAGWPCAPQPIG